MYVFPSSCTLISISAEFERPVSVEAARSAIEAFEGSELVDAPESMRIRCPNYSEVVSVALAAFERTAFLRMASLSATGDQLWKGLRSMRFKLQSYCTAKA